MALHPQDIEDAFNHYLKLRTRPVAVKMFHNRKHLPQEPWEIPVNLCQLVSMARYQGVHNSNESWVPAMPPVFVMRPEYLKG